MKKECTKKDDFKTYLHIGNGGITFDFDSDIKKGVLVIKMHASHFGSKTNEIEIYTDRNSIKQLSDNILKFLEHTKDLDLEYCYPIASFDK